MGFFIVVILLPVLGVPQPHPPHLWQKTFLFVMCLTRELLGNFLIGSSTDTQHVWQWFTKLDHGVIFPRVLSHFRDLYRHLGVQTFKRLGRPSFDVREDSISSDHPLLDTMSDTGAPPVIPTELQQYNSYTEDPKWQIKFTIVWTSVVAFVALTSIPLAIYGFKYTKRALFGVAEDWQNRYRYAQLQAEAAEEEDSKGPCCKRTDQSATIPTIRKSLPYRAWYFIKAIASWTPPFVGGLNFGTIFLVVAYFVTIICCMLIGADLVENSNRAGFLALAQLPPLFLFSAKSSPLALLLPTEFAYTRMNVFHRWFARGVLICVTIHGSLWIRNHLEWNIQIIGQQKETSGIAAFGVLGILALSSVRVVRERAWFVFYWVHFLAFPAFFITLCYHTPYASPWIFAPIAIYAFDLFMRACRFRAKDAYLIRVDDQMTLIRIPDCDTGFRAGQHLRVRVFFRGKGIFESHPLSVMTGPSGGKNSHSCVRSKDMEGYFQPRNNDDESQKPATVVDMEPAGVVLGARLAGDWSRDLNEFAREQGDKLRSQFRSAAPSSSSPLPTMLTMGVPVQVMFDGPYGGCSLDLPSYDRVLLLAGGSGVTTALGLLDELVAMLKDARASDSGKDDSRTKKIHFAWCIRTYSSISWIAPLLQAIASTALSIPHLNLQITIFVTCPCSPDEIPPIPCLEVRIEGRPDMRNLIANMMGMNLLTPSSSPDEQVHRSHFVADTQIDLGDTCPCGCVESEAETQEGPSVDKEKEKGKEVVTDVEKLSSSFEGRLAVSASGPCGLIRATSNAVAGLSGRRRGVELDLHSEVYAL